jgi:hypothetical protein
MELGSRARVEFKLLGPLEVEQDGRTLAIGGRRQRALLAKAAVEQLNDALGDEAYGSAHAEGQALSLDQALALARAMPQ